MFIFILLAVKPSLDLAFILGASGPNSVENFRKQKDIAKHLLSSYNTSPGNTQVSVVINTLPTTADIKFGQFHGANLLAAMEKLPNTKSESFSDALHFANDDLFKPRNGARPGLKKSLVVFVNDDIKDDSDGLLTITKNIKANGINLIVINMDPEANKDKMKAISGLNNVFFFPPLLEELDLALYPIIRAIYPGINS